MAWLINVKASSFPTLFVFSALIQGLGPWLKWSSHGWPGLQLRAGLCSLSPPSALRPQKQEQPPLVP